MDALKKQLDRIQQQLAGLSASQKMLTASLLAIMVMTFIWWGRYAGESEMEPVFNQSLSADDMQNVKRVLTSEGIKFEPLADKILVPTEKKDYAVAALAYAQVLPKNSSGSFDEFMGKMSPFTSPQMGDKLMNEFSQARLTSIIMKMNDGVADASVVVDPSAARVIGGNTEPSAAVSVRMKDGGEGNKHLAESIASFVSGSNAKLRRSRVNVQIGTKDYRLHDPDPNLPDGDADELLIKHETRYQEQVKEALSAYGNVVAVVHAQVDLVSSKETETTFPKVTAKPKSNQGESSNTVTPQAPIAESGTQPNVGASAEPTAKAPVATVETETNKEEFEIFADKKIVDSSKPPGKAKALSAAITIPRTLFVQALKDGDTSAKQPASKDVDALFAKSKDDIIATVQSAIGIDESKSVAVMLGPDLPLLMATDAAASAKAAGSGASVSLVSHFREIAVGALALISLFMVSMMVKKNTPAPVIAAAVELPETATLGGNFDIAGEVSEGGQTLDGMELDDDAVKAQQMVEQVSTMVKENPDAAATLVKRWLNRS